MRQKNRRDGFRRGEVNGSHYFLQHAAQPAAFVQQAVQVAGSLQQLPSHLAAGILHESCFPQQVLEHPVVSSTPVANTAASIIIVLMVVYWSFLVVFCPPAKFRRHGGT